MEDGAAAGSEGSENSQGELPEVWPECQDPQCLAVDHTSLLLEWEAYSGPGEFDYGLEAGYKQVLKKSTRKETVAELTKYTVACSDYFSDGELPSFSNGRKRHVAKGCGSLHWTSVYVGNRNSCRVEDLLPGMGYIFRLFILPKSPLAVAPAPSSEALFFTLPSPPGVPEPPALVDRARTSLKLKWLPPGLTGGMTVTEYLVEMKEPASDAFEKIYAGTCLSFKVTRLVPGMSYIFRMKVANCLGASSFSKQVEYKTTPSVPAAPSSPTLSSSTSNSVVVRWEEPQNHGMPINSYMLEIDDGMEGPFSTVYTGINPRCEVGSLKSGTMYTLRVLAQNDVGKGAFSLPAKVSTASSHPSCPHSVSIRARTAESALVSWSAPEHDGGSSIMGYELEFILKGSHAKWNQVYAGELNAYTLLGLRPGCQYKVRVRAKNAIGAGGFSHEATFGTSPGPPEAPPPPEFLEIHPTSLKLTWGEPCHDGGSAVTGYRLEMLTEGAEEHACVYKGIDMFTVVDGLIPGRSYAFRLQAMNRAGSSSWSESSEMKTKAAKPDAADPPVFTNVSSTSISLRWTPPNSNGSAILSFHLCMAVVGYGVSQRETPHECTSVDSQLVSKSENENGGSSDPQYIGVYNGPAGGYTVKRLQPFTTYAFLLKVSNAVGTSDDSEPVSITTMPSVPEQPAPPFVVEASRNDITLQWQFPERDNGGEVTAFCLEMRNGGPHMSGKRRKAETEASDWSEVYQGSLMSQTVSCLLPGVSYMFRLKAINEHGASVPSVLTASTLPAEPSLPRAPTFTGISPTSVRVRWTAPSCDNGALVLRYKLLMDYTEPGSMQRVYEGESTSYKATKLSPGRVYQTAVQAINSVGASETSHVATVTLPRMSLPTLAAPRVECTSKGVLAISWDKADHADVRSYTLEMESASGKLAEVYEGITPRFYTKGGVHSCKFRVKANGPSELGSGAWSPFSTWIAPAPLAQESSRQTFVRKQALLKKLRNIVQDPWNFNVRLLMLISGVILSLTCSYIHHF